MTWRSIPEFPHYEVSTDGRVRSWRRRPRVWRNPDPRDRTDEPAEMSLGTMPLGYKIVVLRRPDKSKKKWLVHRLVATAFLPNPQSLSDVAHLNGKPGDNRVENLAWMSHRDNQLMMQDHGTQFVACKLTADQVRSIRETVANGPRGTRRKLAKELGMAPASITRIVQGRTWKRDR